MKKNIFLLMACTSLSSFYVTAEASPTPLVNKDEAVQHQGSTRGLNISDRSEYLKNLISRSFDTVSSNQKKWLYNGAKYYCFLGIDPLSILQEKIKSKPSQKDFYVLDIGAGQFDWGKTTAAEINANKDLPNDINVHIISVTGENYGPVKVHQEGRCKTYDVSAFEIENLQKSLQKTLPELSLESPLFFDLVVSAYTFIHVHDPVGLFAQTYDLLRPGEGMMLMHGFPVSRSINSGVNWDASLTYLLHDTKAPYLIGKSTAVREIAPFLLKRPDDKPLNLPYAYNGITNVEVADAQGKEIASVKITYKPLPFNGFIPYLHSNSVQGDKGLYDWVFEHEKNWQERETSWRPFMKYEPQISKLQESSDQKLNKEE